jgi:hypothetical protein
VYIKCNERLHRDGEAVPLHKFTETYFMHLVQGLECFDMIGTDTGGSTSQLFIQTTNRSIPLGSTGGALEPEIDVALGQHFSLP